MANFMRKELNEDELESVNGGVAYNNMMQPGTTLFGTTAGSTYTYSVDTADEANFKKWVASLYVDGMSSKALDAVVFDVLSDPTDDRYPKNFTVNKLDNPLAKPGK